MLYREPSAPTSSETVNAFPCRSGGIGRHSRFKICREQSLVGSSPTFGISGARAGYRIDATVQVRSGLSVWRSLPTGRDLGSSPTFGTARSLPLHPRARTSMSERAGRVPSMAPCGGGVDSRSYASQRRTGGSGPGTRHGSARTRPAAAGKGSAAEGIGRAEKKEAGPSRTRRMMSRTTVSRGVSVCPNPVKN